MEMQVIIGLITDFGTLDHYVGAMKGAIKKENPDVDIIDITHGVDSYSITNAQYVLVASYSSFPAGTVFCIVVDPGVGSGRRALIAVNAGYVFIAPDNGLLSAVAGQGAEVFAIDEGLFPGASPTFHGRDIFAPAAAKLAGGALPSSLGARIHDWVKLELPAYRITDSSVCASVIHVDKFGNVVTSIPSSALEETGMRILKVRTPAVQFDAMWYRTFSDIPVDSCGVISGSSGYVELVLNRQSLSEKYGMNIGAEFEIIYG